MAVWKDGTYLGTASLVIDISPIDSPSAMPERMIYLIQKNYPIQSINFVAYHYPVCHRNYYSPQLYPVYAQNRQQPDSHATFSVFPMLE